MNARPGTITKSNWSKQVSPVSVRIPKRSFGNVEISDSSLTNRISVFVNFGTPMTFPLPDAKIESIFGSSGKGLYHGSALCLTGAESIDHLRFSYAHSGINGLRR